MNIELNYTQYQAFKEKVADANELAKTLGISGIEYNTVEKEVTVGSHWFWGGGYKEKRFNVTITKNLDASFARYEFVSFLEKENGVMFSHTLPNKEIPIYYITDKSYHGCCDHCKQKRNRKSTYIIFDKDEKKHIQVGSTCINDFLVKDVEKILREVFYKVHEVFEPEEGIYYEARNKKEENTYPLINFLGMICSISKFGEIFVSKTVSEQKNIPSTVSIFLEIINYYSNRNNKRSKKYGHVSVYSEEQKKKIEVMYNSIIPTETHYDFVKNVIEWVKTLKNSKNEFEINLYNYFEIYSESGVPASKLNWVASAINSYAKSIKKAKETKEVTDSITSNHIGIVGERLTFKGKIKSIKFLNQTVNYFNLAATYLLTIEDVQGNVYTSFSTKKMDEYEIEKWYEIKATVKKHDIFREIKQTNIFRIKIKKGD